VALLCSLAPLQFYAYLINLFCFGFYAWVCAEFMRQDYAWLVPNRQVRLAACMLMCMAPGLKETLGNLTNIHTACLIFLSIAAMRSLDAPLGCWRIILSAACAMTEGSSFLLVPCYALRCAVLRRHPKRKDTAVPGRDDMIVAGFLCLSFLINLQASQVVVGPTYTASSFVSFFASLPEHLTWLFLDRFVAVPLGWTTLDLCVQRCGPHLFWSLCLPACGWAVFRLVRRLKKNAAWVLLPCLCICAHYLLMWAMRPGTEQLFRMLEVVGNVRHSVASVPLAIILWCTAMQPRYSSGAGRFSLYFWFAFTLTAQQFSLGRMPQGRKDWFEAGTRLQHARSSQVAQTVEVLMAPQGFGLTYHNAQARKLLH
jgi:hypothetical protein